MRADARPLSYVKSSRGPTRQTGREIPHRRRQVHVLLLIGVRHMGRSAEREKSRTRTRMVRTRDVNQRGPCVTVADRNLSLTGSHHLDYRRVPPTPPRVERAASFKVLSSDHGRQRRLKTRATCCMTRLRKEKSTGAHGMRHP